MAKKRMGFWILVGAAVIIAIPLVLFAKQYYDSRYVLHDSYYAVVPLDYDITPSTDQGGRYTDYTLICYNAEGISRELTFSVLIDAHKSDLYPPGIYMRVDVSKHLVIGRRAVDKSSVPELALEKIMAGFKLSTAATPGEYAAKRAKQLDLSKLTAKSATCSLQDAALHYTYIFNTNDKAKAETAATLLDPVYYVQFRTDKDAFPELEAIVLIIKLDDGTVIFSETYDTRVEFDYEKTK